MNLGQLAENLAQRMIQLFLPDAQNKRPIYGNNPHFQNDPHWKNHLLFYEYFHAETGQGFGRSSSNLDQYSGYPDR